MDDETVSTEAGALRLIAERGYLNDFQTPADSWFELGEVPMDADEYGRRVDEKVAEKLIKAGRLVEVSRGHPPGDSTTRVICYRVP